MLWVQGYALACAFHIWLVTTLNFPPKKGKKRTWELFSVLFATENAIRKIYSSTGSNKKISLQVYMYAHQRERRVILGSQWCPAMTAYFPNEELFVLERALS